MPKRLTNRRFGVFAVTVVILTCCTFTALAQNFSTDLDLIATTVTDNDHSTHNKKKVKLVHAINPLYWVYKGSVGLYQTQLSPQLSKVCIYETPCFRFSGKLIGEYGLLKGFFLSADRVGRCNRIARGETSRLRLTPEGKVKEDIAQFSFRK